MSENYNPFAVSIVYDISGEEIRVPFGEGLKTPDRDNIYRYRWSDQLYYKFPEKPDRGFKNVIAPNKMFLKKLSNMTDEEALREVNARNNDVLVNEDLLRLSIACDVPCFMWGPPGHAKTRFVESFAEQKDEENYNFNVESIELTKVSPTIFDGMYYVHPQTGVMVRSIPELADMILRIYKETGSLTIFLVDEVSLGGASSQGASLRLLTHKQMGNVDLSPYIAVVAAANPKKTVKKANDLLESAVNRAIHLPWFMNHEVWEHRWSRGFIPDDEERQRDKEPSSQDKNFVRNLLKNNPSGVVPFESSLSTGRRWTRDDFVPASRELSPRSLTEFMKIKHEISRLCKELHVSEGVRQRYIYFVAKYMFSDVWSDSVIRTLPLEENSFGGYDEVSSQCADVSHDDSSVDEEMLSSLLVMTNGQRLGSAEVLEVLDTALSTITSTSQSNATSRYLALETMWCMALAAERDNDSNLPIIMNALADATQFFGNNRDLLTSMNADSVSPAYATTSLRDKLRLTLQNRS